MKIYKNHIGKKLVLLFCSGFIICTFMNVKVALPAQKEVLQNKVIEIKPFSEPEEYDMSFLFQQNLEKIYEQDVKPVKKTIGGLIVKKRDKITLSKKEKNILYRIVEAEAGGENISGKMLVANVVINRYLSKSFPDTIKGVVFARNKETYQFSPVRDGRYYTVKVSSQTKEAVNNALKGYDNSKGALYFMCRSKADAGNVTWFDRSLDPVLKYGCHEFFK